MEYLTLSTDCGIIKVNVSYGWIYLDSNPAGADIYIATSGVPPINTLLKTPNTINLPIGDYDYIFKLTSYKDYTGTATINTNLMTYITANMVPIISPIVAVSGASLLGLLLAATTKTAIPLTTGKLGGEIVSLKL